jgi:Tol biopolymer transport system component
MPLGVRRHSLPVAAALACTALAVLGVWLLLGRTPDRVVPPGGEPSLAFAEFGAVADRVYLAPPSNPSDRRLVATIDHVEGWGINPAFSISGGLAAYTVLPPGSIPRRDSPAELWLLDLRSGEPSRVARDADLLAAPAFDAQGRRLLYRSTRPDGRQDLVSVDIASRVRRTVHSYEGTFGLHPIGFAPDGAAVFAELSTKGTDIWRVRDGAAPVRIAHASDQIARDYHLSPDGKELSFLAPELLAERWVHRVSVIDLSSGATRALPATPAPLAEQFGPVWTPDGRSVTLGREPLDGAGAAAVTVSLADGTAEALASPRAGFDVPLAWSPSGGYLVARSFDGVSSYQPGRESIVVIGTDGSRVVLETGSELIFLGWVASG